MTDRADPVVSPADTIRLALEALDRERQLLEGRDYDEGELRDNLAALDALLAVGERDKAKMEQMHAHIAGLTDALELLRDSDSGERDRRQIAQLTEVGKAALIVADLNGEMRSTYGRVVTHAEWSTALCNLEMVAIAARAVLADKEDANG